MAHRRPERLLRAAILALLRVHGIAAWPTGVGAFPASYNGKQRFVRVGSKGMSDIIGIMPVPILTNVDGGQPYYVLGRFLAIEVKNPGGKMSPEQTAFLETVNQAGGIGFVAKSCEDVIEKLGLKR